MTAMPPEVATAIERLMVEYCHAVDALDDTGPLLALFAPDTRVDMSALGLPMMNGRDEVEAFFTSVFADMTHHFHFIASFRPEEWDGTNATMSAYVFAHGVSRDGNKVVVQVRYRMTCRMIDGAWKIADYTITPMMPVPGSMEEIHGTR